jgi:hypothetical protein
MLGGGGSGRELELFSAWEWALLCTCVTTRALCGLGVGNLLADRVNHILLTTLAGGMAMVSVVNYNSL